MIGQWWEICSGNTSLPRAQERSEQARAEWDRRRAIVQPGLGDKIESALNLLGISKDRVEKWLGRPCGCKERQEKLNRLGRWAERLLVAKLPDRDPKSDG